MAKLKWEKNDEIGVNCIHNTFEGQVKGSNNKISTIGEKNRSFFHGFHPCKTYICGLPLPIIPSCQMISYPDNVVCDPFFPFPVSFFVKSENNSNYMICWYCLNLKKHHQNKEIKKISKHEKTLWKCQENLFLNFPIFRKLNLPKKWATTWPWYSERLPHSRKS